MERPGRGSSRFACLASAILIVLTAGVAIAHSEVQTATPADGATVPSPFAGPIALTFSAELADRSKADLIGSDGKTIASATVDGPGARMTITLAKPVAAGSYAVKWVSVATDGDLLRGTLTFTVTPVAPTAPPSPTATPAPTASAAATPSAAPSLTATPALPSAVASPTVEPSTRTGDVVLPIIVALIVVAAGGVYLLGRRNRATPP